MAAGKRDTAVNPSPSFPPWLSAAVARAAAARGESPQVLWPMLAATAPSVARALADGPRWLKTWATNVWRYARGGASRRPATRVSFGSTVAWPSFGSPPLGDRALDHRVVPPVGRVRRGAAENRNRAGSSGVQANRAAG
jgi:hypothetical protein